MCGPTIEGRQFHVGGPGYVYFTCAQVTPATSSAGVADTLRPIRAEQARHGPRLKEPSPARVEAAARAPMRILRYSELVEVHAALDELAGQQPLEAHS